MSNGKLIDIVNKLIAFKKEGIHWDFKQEHHKNYVSLIHDIICLANTNYDGDRYIIFGIDDNGVIAELSTIRRKQADIIDILRSAKFADDIFPDVRLESITISNQILDILIINNTTNKPYYLTENKTKDKKTINAGTIYTRVMDTNTPINKVASSRDIEYMWKERFGLTQSPFDRFKIYLNNFNGWKLDGEHWHYKQFPEFTIKPLEDNYCQGCETREWARGEIGYNYTSGNGTTIFGFYYYNTLLKKVCCVQFNGDKKYIVNPDWEPIGQGRIYFYLEDSFEYAYQWFLIQEFQNDFSKNLKATENNPSFDIPIFSNKDKLSSFLRRTREFLNHKKSSTWTSDKKIQNELFYSYVKKYLKWRDNA